MTDSQRELRGGLLLIVGLAIVAFWPSLGGGWVWDDHYVLANPDVFRDVRALVTLDPWAASGHQTSDIYRPLQMLSYMGQLLWPGPMFERLLSLGMHLANVVLVALIARGIGQGTRPALFAAAVFAVHPMATETTAWICGRHILIFEVLLLSATAAVVNGRDRLAVLPLLAAPFAFEPGMFSLLMVGVLGLGLRRVPRVALAAAGAATVLYVGVRNGLSYPLPASMGINPVEALGGTVPRLFQVVFNPAAQDAFALYGGSVAWGVLGVVVGLGLLVAAWGRPSWAVFAALALPVAAAAPASASNGIVADRYQALLMAGVAVLAARGLSVLIEKNRRAGVALAVALPLCLAPFTWLRAHDWRSDEALADASLAQDPANPRAAFHRASAYQRAGDCTSAVPLYRLALSVERRARNNLQVCLMETGQLDDAAQMIPNLLTADDRAGPAYNSALVLIELQRFGEAELMVGEALRRDPTHAGARLLLARLYLVGGLPAEALVLLQGLRSEGERGLQGLIAQAEAALNP